MMRGLITIPADKAVPFIRGKIIPVIENVINTVKGWFE
jgi:hypothetical protein